MTHGLPDRRFARDPPWKYRSVVLLRQIPYTPILRRYHDLERKSRAARLREAIHLADDPEPLIADFVTTVEQVARGYSNAYEGFLPRTQRTPLPRPDGSVIPNTRQLVARLPKSGVIPVTGRPALNFRYVEREVSVLRTKGARFDEPEQKARSAGRALLCDLLLVNANDKTPIVAEIKVTRDQYTDKDPYSALVQALASAAHLVTPSQYERLRHCFKRRFAAERLRVDVYVLTGSYNRTLTDMADLLDAALALGSKLGATPGIKNHIRRIAFLDVVPRGRGVEIRQHRRPTQGAPR